MELDIGHIDKAKRVDLGRWAKYTVEKFEFAISKYKAIDSGDLLNSFFFQVSEEAGGNRALISFAFQYYLRMVDMGVGKGVRYDERKEAREEARLYGRKHRRPKPVYNKILWAEMHRLEELLGEYYAKLGAELLLFGIES